MQLGLRAGVSFCEVGGRLVFLDTYADRYFGLGPDAEAAFRSIMEEQPASSSREAALRRFDDGLFVEGGTPLLPCSPPQVTRESLLDAPPPSIPLSKLLTCCTGLSRARLTLRMRGLRALLQAMEYRKARVRAVDDRERLVATAHGFERSARLTRSHDRCLIRSAAIMDQLLAQNISAELVIGVRLRPFAAHAWVRQDGWLISDRYDSVRSYTPILRL